MPDSRAEAQKIQGEPGISACAKKQENAQNEMVVTWSCLERTPIGHTRDNLKIKLNADINRSNPTGKTGNF